MRRVTLASRVSSAATASVVLFLLASALVAQVRPGDCVVSTFRWPNATNAPGAGGLFLVNPCAPGAAQPILNLPPSVSGCIAGSGFAGTDFVLIQQNGTIVTNGWACAAGSGACTPLTPNMIIYVLSISPTGLASVVQSYDVGTILTTSFVGLPQAAHLPNGRILLAVDRIGAPGQTLSGATLGIVDLTVPPANPSAVTAVPMTWAPSASQLVNGLAVDPLGTTAWFAVVNLNTSNQCTNTDIMQVSLTAPGTPTSIQTVTGCVNGLAYDPANASLLLARGSGGTTNLVRIDAATGAPLGWVGNTISGALNSVAIEPASGDILVTTNFASTASPPSAYRIGPGGSTTLLSSGPPATFTQCAASPPGWGWPSGIAIAPTHRVVGPASPSACTSYDWVQPSPSGFPCVGNTAFTVTLSSATGVAPGWLGISSGLLASPIAPVPGVQIYLDPTTLQFQLAAFPLSPLPTQTINVPIPNVPSLSGATFYLQSVHADPCFTWSSSSALAVTLR